MRVPMSRNLRNILYTLLMLSFILHMVMSYRAEITVTEDFKPYQINQNTAVFAAYSADGTVSDYVISYLKALKEVAPNIIYITDNPIRRADIDKISPYITRLEAKRHGEYDWGSYKRGYNWLKDNRYLNKTGLLIFANDSSLLVAESLKPVINAIPQDADFYGITANQDGTYHLQSYFLVFNPEVYNTREFADYLNNVKPQKDGLTVAYSYEVPLTAYLEGLGFKSGTYIPYEELSALPLNDKNCYPLTMLSKYHAPFLKMRTFTNRLDVQEPRRLVFQWLKKNNPTAYKDLIKHLKKIHSPYLEEDR